MEDLQQQTRQALRRLGKSVAIITTRWNDARLAMAATAVEGLSLDPPSLLICVNKTASVAAPLIGGRTFAVNLLGSGHVDLPARCSAPWRGEDRFAIGAWSDHDEDGVPILVDAQASFVCVPDMNVDYGTHHIVVGKILRVVTDGGVDPLLYVDGAYHRALAL